MNNNNNTPPPPPPPPPSSSSSSSSSSSAPLSLDDALEMMITHLYPDIYYYYDSSNSNIYIDFLKALEFATYNNFGDAFLRIYYNYYEMINRLLYIIYTNRRRYDSNKSSSPLSPATATIAAATTTVSKNALEPHSINIEITNYPIDSTPFDQLLNNVGKLVNVEGIVVKMSQPYLMIIGYRLECTNCNHTVPIYLRLPYRSTKKPPPTTTTTRNYASDAADSNGGHHGGGDSSIVNAICLKCGEASSIVSPIYMGYCTLTLQEDIGGYSQVKQIRFVDVYVELRKLMTTTTTTTTATTATNANNINLGDRVKITGIVIPYIEFLSSSSSSSSSSIIATPKGKGGIISSSSGGNNRVRTTGICIEASHVEPLNKAGVMLTDDDIDTIKSILKRNSDEKAYKMLVSSFAPHIYSYEVVKEAILLQLALSGIERSSASSIYNKRMNLHILLVGDPGTSKSQLLLYTSQLAPVSVYTTGKGSSAAGLSVTLVRESDGGGSGSGSGRGGVGGEGGGAGSGGGRWAILAGATVLASGGIACIDEFLTMRPEDRAVLHEIMEQQTVSIAKAGINTRFKAETSILAACNPVNGYYDPYKPLTENLMTLPPSLLSRFDLIFVLRDNKAKDTDTLISNTIVANLYKDHHSITTTTAAAATTRKRIKKTVSNNNNTNDTNTNNTNNELLNTDLLSKWLLYCRRFQPVIEEDAAEKLQKYYLELRARSSITEGMLITPRQLETLVRLATARARLLCRENVVEEDVDTAIRVYEHMLSTFIDTTTNNPDIGFITGTSVGERAKKAIFLSVLKSLQSKYPTGFSESMVISELVKTTQFTEETAMLYFAKAQKEGLVYEIERDKFKVI